MNPRRLVSAAMRRVPLALVVLVPQRVQPRFAASVARLARAATSSASGRAPCSPPSSSAASCGASSCSPCSATGAATTTIPSQRQYLVKLEILYTRRPDRHRRRAASRFSYRTQNEVDALERRPRRDPIDVRGLPVAVAVPLPRRRRHGHRRRPTSAPVLVLPVDRTVRLVLTSPDVIHSFYVPELPVQTRR